MNSAWILSARIPFLLSQPRHVDPVYEAIDWDLMWLTRKLHQPFVPQVQLPANVYNHHSFPYGHSY